MAGRIRTIKPEIIEDAVTAGLSHEAFRLFIGMIVLADDHGLLRGGTKWLEGQVFHGCPIPEGRTIDDLLDELERKLVKRYGVDGQPYAWIVKWRDHQRIDHPGPPRVPVPPWFKVERIQRDRTHYDYQLVPAPGAGTAPDGSGTERVGSGTAPPGLDHDHDHDQDHDPDPDEDRPAAPRTSRLSKEETSALAVLDASPHLRHVDRDLLARAVVGLTIGTGIPAGVTVADVLRAACEILAPRCMDTTDAPNNGQRATFIINTCKRLFRPGELEKHRRGPQRAPSRGGMGGGRRDAPTLSETQADTLADADESQRRIDEESREAERRRVQDEENRQRWRAEQAKKRAKGEPSALDVVLKPPPSFSKPKTNTKPDDDPGKGEAA